MIEQKQAEVHSQNELYSLVEKVQEQLKKLLVDHGVEQIVEKILDKAQTAQNKNEAFVSLSIVLERSFYQKKISSSTLRKVAEMMITLIKKQKWEKLKTFAINSLKYSIEASQDYASPLVQLGILDLMMEEVNPDSIRTGVSAANLINEIIEVNQQAKNQKDKVLNKITNFLKKIKDTVPMREFLREVVSLISQFTLPCFEEDPIRLLCEMLKQPEQYCFHVLDIVLAKLTFFAEKPLHLIKIIEAHLIPHLITIAKQEKLLEQAVLYFMDALSKSHEARTQMLENKIFVFTLGFLFHKVAHIRKLTVHILLEITSTQRSDFLLHTTMVDKLFKMLKNDEPEIKDDVLALFTFHWEDDESKKVKFWMEKDIIQKIEIMLLTETDKIHLLQRLDCLAEIQATGDVLATPENIITLRIERSTIPKRKKQIYSIP